MKHIRLLSSNIACLACASSSWLITDGVRTAHCSTMTAVPSSASGAVSKVPARKSRDVVELERSLSGPSILMKDKAHFKRVLLKMIEDGPERLTVLSDFDFTMTKFYKADGTTRSSSCHKVLEECQELGQEYRHKAAALQDYYYPREIDPNIPMPEKVQFMVDWVNKAHDLLINNGLVKANIKTAVRAACTGKHINLRDGICDFLDLLEQMRVPLIVFSAGLADILEEVIMMKMERDHLPSNIYVLSNRFIFDSTQKLTGFTEPVLHVFNKTGGSFRDTAYFLRKDAVARKNFVLIGDSLGDLSMIEGIPHENLLKIGFLNDRVDERLETYLEKYDVVILGDPDFNTPFRLLELISV